MKNYTITVNGNVYDVVVEENQELDDEKNVDVNDKIRMYKKWKIKMYKMYIVKFQKYILFCYTFCGGITKWKIKKKGLEN